MANKGRTELATCAPESPEIPTMAADHPVSDTVPESVPGSETLDPPNHGSPAGYEQLREQRIKENRERMQKLGIADLSVKLKTAVAPKRAPRNFSSERKTPIRALATEPRRRSSRLQSVSPVSYVENVKLPKEERKYSILLEEGSKPEFYTEEHEKLLGSTELEWTFFVDGYGADGRRIYDPVNGKTCHQCRQKTLGHRTHCAKCQMVQGQFCGDCLYMRYGEHVLEAKKNPDWICPPCRGICNCSLCRQARGWAPTGPMYKRIASAGYKSVAHFLIQTKRAPPATDSEEENVSKTPHSAKRTLAFTDMEVSTDGVEPQKKGIGGQKLDYGEKEEKDSKAAKEGEQEDYAKNDISKKTGESKDVKGEQEEEEDSNKKDFSITVLKVGESEVKDGCEMKDAEDDDQKEDRTTEDHATKTVSSCEPKLDITAYASQATIKFNETPTTTKTRPAKRLSAARDSPLQDSIARRLRPRIKA